MSKVRKYKNLRNGEILILDVKQEVREINGDRFIPAIEESKIGTAAERTGWYREDALVPVKEKK
jgi:hypothetical protein